MAFLFIKWLKRLIDYQNSWQWILWLIRLTNPIIVAALLTSNLFCIFFWLQKQRQKIVLFLKLWIFTSCLQIFTNCHDPLGQYSILNTHTFVWLSQPRNYGLAYCGLAQFRRHLVMWAALQMINCHRNITHQSMVTPLVWLSLVFVTNFETGQTRNKLFCQMSCRLVFEETMRRQITSSCPNISYTSWTYLASYCWAQSCLLQIHVLQLSAQSFQLQKLDVNKHLLLNNK